MTCSAPYGGGQPTCTVPTAPIPTHTSVGTPVSRTPSEIPFTGGDVIGLVVIAVILILVGVCTYLATASHDRWNRRQ